MNLQYSERAAESLATAITIGAGHLLGADHVHLRVLTTAAKNEDDQPTKKEHCGGRPSDQLSTVHC